MKERMLAAVPIAHWRRNFLPLAALCSLFVFTYYQTLQSLVVHWWTHPFYSHGFMIPPLAAYVLWTKREDFRHCRKKPSWAGLGVLLVGLIVFVVGVLGNEEFIEQVSLPLTLFGLLYFLGGSKVAGLSWFSMLYLYLMIPPPLPVYKAVSLELRLLDAHWVAVAARWFGVPIFRDGYFLYLPDIVLEVADACSGVFSIVALLSLGLLYIRKQHWGWHRYALLLLLVPIAILANGIRILMITVLTYYSGPWILDTTFHSFNGTFNFLLSLGMLIGLGMLLRCIPVWRSAR